MNAEGLMFFVLIALLACLVLKPFLVYLLDPLSLRKYPAPSFLAAATPFWHQRLGDSIRIAPSLIIFNIPEAVPDIYGHSAARKLVKDTFYDKIAGEERDIVNVIDHDDHSQRRKYLSNSFALKTVTDMECVIRQNFQRLIGHMDSVAAGNSNAAPTQTLDIRRWFNYFTLDVIGDMAFSLPMGFLAGGCDTTRVKSPEGREYDISSAIDTLHRGTRLSTTLAQLSSNRSVQLVKIAFKCSNWLKRLTGIQGIEDFDNICINQLKKTQRLANGTPNRSQKDFLSKILMDREGKDRYLSSQRLLAESIVFMNAGSETTAAALSSSLYFLLSNPKCFDKLRAEIDARLEPGHDGIIPYDSVKDLPYLRACIDEALRLRPPIAYALQRLVVSTEGAIIAGHHIKQGTTVAVSPWTIHRNRKLYKNPDDFDPERWFDPEQLSNLRKYYIVFSQGPRQCLGRHIAIVELQILISTLVRRYNMSLADEARDFVIYDRFNSNPGPLSVRVERRVFVD
ncbi:benzoate 4-monooxygenase cytochrome P450 [Fusarium beomiforme]|uniref:Benzoate 4-monooxygenase cytochrome P450 n=1 Tax=Fusarium beomiforme TaxID=44412 RepID=A0A9P5AWS3_9HYPO|nr:benzoate 4-monooxygenase cytochrome P450 [Fusarium beomiforme]